MAAITTIIVPEKDAEGIVGVQWTEAGLVVHGPIGKPVPVAPGDKLVYKDDMLILVARADGEVIP